MDEKILDKIVFFNRLFHLKFIYLFIYFLFYFIYLFFVNSNRIFRRQVLLDEQIRAHLNFS